MTAPAWPTADTRLVALLGDPVRHSVSPVMHNAAFREQDLELVYVALRVPAGLLATVVEALGAVGAIGANVTVPHKEAVVPLCDSLTDEAELVGAVNTLVWERRGLVGDNTDASGLEAVLRDDLALAAGARVVVIGTGGAARAAAVALGRAGATASFVGRRPGAAAALAALARQAGAAGGVAVDLADGEGAAAAVAAADVVVNATPVGMDGYPDRHLPEPFHRLTADQVALDLVYRPLETPFLRDARAAGADTHHGLGMLVAQAARAYRRWTGRDAPEATMSAAAMATLLGDSSRISD